ncbi:MAG: putative serine protease PepD [Solirubrobacteraceae bacterium]|nr:putative serine protease PepD [Solirubrobacteraceae bacterium]
MSTSLLRPPESGDRWSSDEDRAAPHGPGPGGPGGAGGGGGGGGGRRPDAPGGRSPRRAPLALLLVLSAMLGGGAGVGVLAATGVVGGDAGGTTTIVQGEPAAATSSSGDGAVGRLDAEALYASTSAGVVDIKATGVSSASARPTPFGGPPQQPQSTASGTGFVIDKDGHIVTASHVVDGASSITITFEDGVTRTAKLLGKDDATDVAVLKIDPAGLTLHPLKLARSASLNVGDEVAAIGDPFGYARSISTGIVSGVDRTIEAPNGFTVAHAIQTDAALNPGNSGGPLLNASGEVVGIADQIATGGSEQNAGVGFAVPIDLATTSLAKLKAGEKVSHAYLGVATSGASSTRGAVLGTLASGGPAADAGLRAGDVVTKLGDTTITNANDLVAAIADHQPGDEVKATVKRGSQTVEMTVTLGTQPAQSSAGG